MDSAATLSLRAYGASPGSHAHPHFQVLTGLDGALELDVQGRGHRIGAGDSWVVPPGERHDFEAINGSRCLVLDTRDPRWADCGPDAANRAQAAALAHYLAAALQASSDLARVVGPRLLLDAWRGERAPLMARSRRRIDWAGLAAWTQAHLHLPLIVADLAERACLSPSQFAARCRAEHGMAAMQWLRDQRLWQARLLRADGWGVAEIASQTGYRSPSALTAALRRQGPRH